MGQLHRSITRLICRSLNKRAVGQDVAIQELWSGYGTLNRVVFDDETSVIVKEIQPHARESHPRGWDTDFSHQRKLKSYQVETYWYQNYNHLIPRALSPRHLYSGDKEGIQFLVLEDMGPRGFATKQTLRPDEIQKCIEWLARFHAHYLEFAPKGLWSVGTYWHLQTRPDEFDRITDPELKRLASRVDSKLNSAKYMSIVHGDAKLANFLFSSGEVAAVDFQYAGGGVGVKDLAYFLSSVFEEDELLRHENDSLDLYFSHLREVLEPEGSDFQDQLESEWRALYPFVWCDFYRFLQGWSPDHWKINSYCESMKYRVLKCLSV